MAAHIVVEEAVAYIAAEDIRTAAVEQYSFVPLESA